MIRDEPGTNIYIVMLTRSQRSRLWPGPVRVDVERRRCWVCKGWVRPDEPTISPTVCAHCYEALYKSWR
jgi:hypothetical protein